MIYAGQYYNLAIKTDGTLWTWGSNLWGASGYAGMLGDNTRTHRSSPVQTIAGGTNWKSVTAGGYNVAGIKTDGTLWLWGHNIDGQLGDGTRTHRSSPIQTIAGGTNWKEISMGSSNAAAIKTDGTLWTWGDSFNGILGDGTVLSRSSPVQTVAGGTNWKMVNMDSWHSAAIKTDGTLWIWGSNADGELGDGTNIHRSSPIQTVSGGSNWKQVNLGLAVTAAIKTDGTLWLWGSGGPFGNVGDGTVLNRSSPVQTISGGTNWKMVACGNYHTAAITFTES
jgi:alpha-tubulin suppressor-like RCC1 family protein